ncbi:MAG: DMT family transporter [Acidobacteria bacterium]|nr:DMT family transporter [Acidobacteriota bacterium]
MSRSLKAHLLLILVTFVWGATFVQIKDALRDITPLLLNTVRMALAAVCLAIIYRRHLRITAGAFKAGALVGALLWLGYEFQTKGLVYTTAAKSGLLTGVSVVLVPIFLALIWRRHVNHWTLAGVAIAFAGLFLLTVPPSNGLGLLSGVNKGDWMTIACAALFALQIIFLGRAMRTHPYEQIAFLQIAVACALMALTVPVVEHASVTWSPRVIAAIVVTGVFGTAMGFSIQAWAQQFTPPTHTALIFMMEPVFAWATSYVLLKERLGLRATVGALLIIAGVLLSELKGSAEHPEEEVGDNVKTTAG